MPRVAAVSVLRVQRLARRIVDAVPTAFGAVLIRDRCGRAAVVDAVVDECLRRGLEPVIEHVDNERLSALIGSLPVDELERWDVDRLETTIRVSALVVLGGWALDTSGLPASSVKAWASAVRRVEAAFETRRVPEVFVAVPTETVAAALRCSLSELDALVLPALEVSVFELRASVQPVLAALANADIVEVTTSAGTLTTTRGTRSLLVDDGAIDREDIAAGAVVSNLPAGSIYWTVIEEGTRGLVALTDGSTLRFDGSGRVADGPYVGERLPHLGIGSNPRVPSAIGWQIVDEHRPGAVFLALGENRYMGGSNASAINIDLTLAQPTVRADNLTVVSAGQLIATSFGQR